MLLNGIFTAERVGQSVGVGPSGLLFSNLYASFYIQCWGTGVCMYLCICLPYHNTFEYALPYINLWLFSLFIYRLTKK